MKHATGGTLGLQYPSSRITMMASWVEKGKGGVELKVIERTEGGYEVQDAPFGKVYKWCPENVVVKCECGERLALTSLETTCGRCGVDHESTV